MFSIDGTTAVGPIDWNCERGRRLGHVFAGHQLQSRSQPLPDSRYVDGWTLLGVQRLGQHRSTAGRQQAKCREHRTRGRHVSRHGIGGFRSGGFRSGGFWPGGFRARRFRAGRLWPRRFWSGRFRAGRLRSGRSGTGFGDSAGSGGRRCSECVGRNTGRDERSAAVGITTGGRGCYI